MNAMIRVGGPLLSLVMLLAACSANVGDDGGTGATQSAVSTSGTNVATSHDGRAYALEVRAGAVLPGLALGARVDLSDTGPLPSSGGSSSAHLVTAEAAGLVGTAVLDAKTYSDADATVSSSSVDGLAIHIPGVLITANVLASSAVATCDSSCGGATTDGGADIVGLAIDGKGIVVTGKPNQTINLGIAKIVINEISEATSSAGTSEIHVAALHVTALGLADIVIAAANAGVTCAYDGLPKYPVNPPGSCTSSAQCPTGQPCYNGTCID